MGLFSDFKIVEQPFETRFYEILKFSIDSGSAPQARGGWVGVGVGSKNFGGSLFVQNAFCKVQSFGRLKQGFALLFFFFSSSEGGFPCKCHEIVIEIIKKI